MVAASRRLAHLGDPVALATRAGLAFASCALLLAWPARAEAPDAGSAIDSEPASSAPSDAAPETGAVAALEPPQPLRPTTVPYPAHAPAHEQPIVVRIKMSVGVDGAVHKVELLTHSLPVFDDAVVAAAQAFQFEPARYGGKPVSVEITFTQTFEPPPPPPPPAEEGPPLVSALRGRLIEMGTRLPVANATVVALVGERHYSVDSDAKGRFRLPVPAGDARVTVHAANCNAFLQQEHLAPQQELAVTYYIERERYDPYEIVIVGDKRREEVSRITLRGAEIQQIPGTFGDPFRVIQTLPGTASVISLLPYPVIRGASPSSSGYLLDGTRIPLLYHLLVGTSVIHPEFIDEIEFHPGGAPVTYGGYTGGIIDGHTRRARSDEKLIDLDANLTQAGGFVREPIPGLGITATAAARYGYPGLILSLATNQLSLSYWDYQFRLDGGNSRNGWTAMFFGAKDELDTPSSAALPGSSNPPLAPALILDFDRADLRAYHGSGNFDGRYRLVLGYDHTDSSGSNVATWVLEPSMRWNYSTSDRFTLVWGLEGSYHDFNQGQPSATRSANAISLSTFTSDLRALFVGSALVEMLWRPTARWLIRPGVREDVYYDYNTTKSSTDPRLTLRYKLTERQLPELAAGSDANAIWLKAAVGIYHQPPRFVLPLPGFDTMPLRYGLQQSIQTSLGIEAPLREHFSLSLEGYFAYMNPTIFDLSVNSQDLNTTANPSLIPNTTIPPTSTAQQLLDRLASPTTGRAFGIEAMIRRESKSGLFGWLSYSLSRSERFRDGSWVPYDFDRTHLVNLVAGLRLPRNWDLGVRFQYQSGLPETTTSGYNTARADGYSRVDLRIDKRAVWNKWMLDFYIDILNAALLPEEVTPGTYIRYVLPTAGIRARL
jgi:TonB family protein